MKGWLCHSEGVKFLIYSVLQLKFDNPIEWDILTRWIKLINTIHIYLFCSTIIIYNANIIYSKKNYLFLQCNFPVYITDLEVLQIYDLWK